MDYQQTGTSDVKYDTTAQPYAQPVVYTQPTTYQQQPPYQESTFYQPQQYAYHQQQPMQSTTVTSYGYENRTLLDGSSAKDRADESSALMMLVIGFFFGLCWIIGWAMYKNSNSPRARSYAKTSLILFIASLVFSLFFAVIFIIIMSTTVASAY